MTAIPRARFLLHTLLVLLLVLPAQTRAQADAAGLEQAAGAVYASFFEAMTKVDMDKVVSLFTEDALFWGTTTKVLATDTAGIEAYFAPLRASQAGQNIFRAVDYRVVPLNADTLLLSGRWEAGAATAAELTRMRVSMVLVRRGSEWKIAQFHNSMMPQ